MSRAEEGKRFNLPDAVGLPDHYVAPDHEMGRNVVFLYFSSTTLQVPRVARQCMVALCEGVAALGADVEMVSPVWQPSPHEPICPPLRELYGVEEPVQFFEYRFPFISMDYRGPIKNLLRILAYTWHMIRFRLRRRGRDRQVIVCSRNSAVLTMLSLFRKLTGFDYILLADLHGLPHNGKAERTLHRVDGSMCISGHLARILDQRLNLGPHRFRGAHGGVKPERYLAGPEEDPFADLRDGRKIVCYTGKVYYRYEEVAYLIETAGLLRDEILMVIVGGRPDQIPPWQKECADQGIDNVVFHGFVQPSRIPDYLKQADLLVMYYSPSPLNDYRSPGKLFEYLASGTPLIGSHFPGTAEVIVDGVNGFLIEPYQPALLARKIRTVFGLDPRILANIAQNGRDTVQHYTWRHRAAQFLDHAHQLKAENGSHQRTDGDH